MTYLSSRWAPLLSYATDGGLLGEGSEWILIAVIAMLPSFVAIIDMFRWRSSTWVRARQLRLLWILLALWLGPLGALLYATGPRLVLRRTVREMRSERVGRIG